MIANRRRVSTATVRRFAGVLSILVSIGPVTTLGGWQARTGAPGLTMEFAPVRDSITVSGPFASIDESAGAEGSVPFGAGVSRLTAGIMPPTALKQVTPSYTVDALRNKVHGTVVLDVVVAADGHVTAARVTQSVDPQFGLDARAVDAAMRWEFRPALDASRKPTAVIIPLELEFVLHGRRRDSLQPSTTPLPRRLVEVTPTYPPAALAARVAGVVGIDATIDPKGSVIDPTVFESVPLLDQAALAAVSKWRYEPTIDKGVAVEVPVAIYVTFRPR